MILGLNAIFHVPDCIYYTVYVYTFQCSLDSSVFLFILYWNVEFVSQLNYWINNETKTIKFSSVLNEGSMTDEDSAGFIMKFCNYVYSGQYCKKQNVFKRY